MRIGSGRTAVRDASVRMVGRVTSSTAIACARRASSDRLAKTRVRSELEASCAPQDATASMAEFVAQTEVVSVQLDSPEVDAKCVSGA